MSSLVKMRRIVLLMSVLSSVAWDSEYDVFIHFRDRDGDHTLIEDMLDYLAEIPQSQQT